MKALLPPSLHSADDRDLAERFRRAQTIAVAVCRKLNLKPEDYFPWVAQANVAAAVWRGDIRILDYALVVVDHVYGRKSIIWINKAFLQGSERDVATFTRFHLRWLQANDRQARIDELKRDRDKASTSGDDNRILTIQAALNYALDARTRARNRQLKRTLADHARASRRLTAARQNAALRQNTDDLAQLASLDREEKA
jgi:hypothetical protein